MATADLDSCDRSMRILSVTIRRIRLNPRVLLSRPRLFQFIELQVISFTKIA